MYRVQKFFIVALLTAGINSNLQATVKNTGANVSPDSTSLNKFSALIPSRDEAVNAAPSVTTLTPAEITAEKKKAEALIEMIKSQALTISQMDPAIPVTLPIGISKTVAGVENTIVFDDMEFTPDGGALTAYMSVQPPKSERKFAFKGTDIRFKKSGFTGNARLELMGNDTIVVSPNKINLIIKGENQKSYVEFDCQGFKQFGIEGSVEFSKKLLIREKADGTLDTTKKVSADFITNFAGWDDLLVEINLGAFQIKGLKDVSFNVSNAVFDFSNTQNSSSVKFPSGYETTSVDWEGVFVSELTIKLPKQLKDKNNNRVTFSATNMLIDNMGLSGSFTGTNLLSLGNGNASGWAFSVDTTNIVLCKSVLSRFKLNGGIQIPINEESASFKYSGIYSSTGSLSLNVVLNSTEVIQIPAFNASATFLTGSYILMDIDGSSIKPKVSLNGYLCIASTGNSPISINKIEFQELALQTVQPYVSIHYLALSGSTQNSMSNFPITLKGISATTSENNIGIGFVIAVNFTGNDESGLAADGSFTVWAEQKTVNNRNRLSFKSIELNSLSIDANFGALAFKGSLIVYRQDATYGNGFKGSVEVTFTPTFTAKTTAQFGNVTGVGRYWYVDGLVTFSPGITVYPGFCIFGFGGGAYYHMKRTPPASINVMNASTSAPSPTGSAGQSASGVKYVPNKDVGLGVIASVVIGTAKPEVFNADVSFEIAFNSGGGLSTIAFRGNALLMTKLEDRNKSNPPFKATVDIQYDFNNKTLDANAEVYINFEVIKGTGPNNRAGWMQMHFGKGNWWIYAGSPSDRNEVKLLDLATINSYFMVGTKVPPIPPLPSKVTSILGELGPLIRDDGTIGEGGGIVFGASASVSTGDKTFLIFYGHFDLGAGFDLMLRNFGNAHCSGETTPIGLNGWYAAGQAYAYVDGEIGVKVKILWVRKKITILDLAAAAVLQAKLPNPSWMKGAVGGYYSVLGGAIKGSCRFEFTLGESCTITGEDLYSNLKVIDQIKPEASSTNFSVASSPSVTFVSPVETIMRVPDADGNNHNFRFIVDYFKIKKGSTEIAGSLNLNGDKTKLFFIPGEWLPANTMFNASIKIHFEEQVNGAWVKGKDESGNYAIEEKTVSFTTGALNISISPELIAYTYPVQNQLCFYKNEYSKGYIIFRKSFASIFKQTDIGKYKVVITDAEGKTYMATELKYDADTKTLLYSMPNSLENGKLYNITLLVIKEGTNLISYNFRSSKYNTFAEKVNALKLVAEKANFYVPNSDPPIIHIVGDEGFDGYEKACLTLNIDTANSWVRKSVEYPTTFNPNYTYMPILVFVNLPVSISDAPISGQSSDYPTIDQKMKVSLFDSFDQMRNIAYKRECIKAMYVPVSTSPLVYNTPPAYQKIPLYKTKYRINFKYSLPGNNQTRDASAEFEL